MDRMDAALTDGFFETTEADRDDDAVESLGGTSGRGLESRFMLLLAFVDATLLDPATVWEMTLTEPDRPDSDALLIFLPWNEDGAALSLDEVLPKSSFSSGIEGCGFAPAAALDESFITLLLVRGALKS